ncbi:uncharacterized protein LOC124924679 [Impatiens glandulifera]|uniref:uncharacterized protein LOC124924679 n=1 Tax=Impatiens glandulifera TaxID=253017 RepID=UPI001FB0E36D|nr:uncharacterized protein LOC124924679 [Impatiens glandulifera]
MMPVNKVFIETEESISPSAVSNGKEKEESSGPYCNWSRKAVEATVSPSPETCKKSNSTGFSKLWRFHDLLNRSNSDGKDAYVYLNGSASRSKVISSEKRQVAAVSSSASAGEKMKPKTKKGVKTAAAKAHEKYLRSKDNDRRRTYLPYRPELMGFFTNIHGGMTRNVHPF